MTTDTSSAAAAAPAAAPVTTVDNSGEVRRLATLFGLVYFAQGIAQVVCLINQPLKYYLRQHLGYDAKQIAAFLVVVMLPWMLKPLYGLLSDFVPLGGYRRKSYLLVMNLVAAGAFCWVFGIRSPGALTAALFLTGVGVACSDVVVDALMVEAGQRTGRVKLFQGVQWICISAAGIGSAWAGGVLCEHFAPDRALGVAALISAGVVATVAVVAWVLVREPRARMDLPQLAATAAGIGAAFTSPRLWMVVLFLALAHFNPGMVTPLYIHFTETMRFSQEMAGRMDAVVSFGYVVGAGIFTALVAPRLSTRGGLTVGLLAFAAGTLSYLMLRGPMTATVSSFLYGTGYMLCSLALLSLAAEACPKRAEGFTFAALMSAINFSMQGADYVGGYLYDHVTKKAFWPLPILSAAITLLAVAIVPLLPQPGPKPEPHGFPVEPTLT
jgi:MFS family permease